MIPRSNHSLSNNVDNLGHLLPTSMVDIKSFSVRRALQSQCENVESNSINKITVQTHGTLRVFASCHRLLQIYTFALPLPNHFLTIKLDSELPIVWNHQVYSLPYHQWDPQLQRVLRRQYFRTGSIRHPQPQDMPDACPGYYPVLDNGHTSNVRSRAVSREDSDDTIQLWNQTRKSLVVLKTAFLSFLNPLLMHHRTLVRPTLFPCNRRYGVMV